MLRRSRAFAHPWRSIVNFEDSPARCRRPGSATLSDSFRDSCARSCGSFVRRISRPPVQQSVKVACKSLSISLAESRRATCVYSTGSHGIHEIPHVQPRFYIVLGMKLATRAQDTSSFFYRLCRQWDIARNHQITSVKPLDDLLVSNVKSGSNLKHLDEGGSGYVHRLIGDQCQYDTRTLGCPEQNFFYHDRTSVSVYPDFHLVPVLCSPPRPARRAGIVLSALSVSHA